MTKQFTRKKEDFVCEHCQASVSGNGYTNHCPKCLYSKHVDVNPGDRVETCCGLMQPVGIEQKSREFIITHKCSKCGFKRKNKANKNDNFDEIVKITQRRV